MQNLSFHIRNRLFHVDRFASLFGAAGLGYLVLQRLKCGLWLALLMVMAMAITKVFLFQIADGKPLIPRGRSTGNMIAWWALAAPLGLFFLGIAVMMIVLVVGAYM